MYHILKTYMLDAYHIIGVVCLFKSSIMLAQHTFEQNIFHYWAMFRNWHLVHCALKVKISGYL